VLPLLLVFSAPEVESPLKNGGFEDGGESSVSQWMAIYPPSLATPAPSFTASERAPHGGSRCGSIVVDYDGGFTSFTQNVHPKKDARFVSFSAWCRIDDKGKKGAASLQVFFDTKGPSEGGSSVLSRRLTTEEEWTLLEIDAAIPEGTRQIVLRCGVFGPCSASFDDAAAAISSVEKIGCKLAVAHGDYVARAEQSSDEPWISVSIPFPFGGQTPLAVRATSEPQGRVIGLEIEKDRDNRPIKLILKPMKRGENVDVRVETLALLRDRPLSEGEGVALPSRGRVPKDVLPHLEDAPGIDVGAAGVKKAAAQLSRKDLSALMKSLQEFLRANMKYDAGTSQGAEECLEAGKAVCTGYANLTASLLIANKVPARILACTGLNARLQEHYIVEVWTAPLGWSRIESTMAAFPWRDSENLVLRVVYPDAWRSTGDVPLYKSFAPGMGGGFRMGKDDCWQGGEVLDSLALEAQDVDSLEKVARAAFENFTRQRTADSKILLLSAPDLETSEAVREVHLSTEQWLEKIGKSPD